MPPKRVGRPLADPGLRSILTDLRKRIISGRMPAGGPLPSVRELASTYGVTGTTIHRCLLQLAAAGFITTHDRIGSRVAEFPPHRYNFGLVLPELPGIDGSYPSRHLQAKVDAARIINQDVGPRLEIFHGISSHPELAEHQRLLSALSQRRVAGLLIHDAERIRDWLDPARIGVPVIGVNVDPSRPMIGQLHLRLPMFLSRALAEVAARGLRRPAVLINHLSHACVPELLTEARSMGLSLPLKHIHCLPTEAPEWAAHLIASLFSMPANEAPDAVILGDEGVIPAVQAALAEHGAAHLFQIQMTNFPCASPVPGTVLRLGWDMVAYLKRAMTLMDAWHRTRHPIGDSMLELTAFGRS